MLINNTILILIIILIILLVALHQAQQDLNNGIIDRAIVGGASLTIDPQKNQIFNAFSMLSPTGITILYICIYIISILYILNYIYL